jgi:hypothetical protein
MILKWGNGFLSFGQMPHRGAYGLTLCWGRRDLLGEKVLDSDPLFADCKEIIICSDYDLYLHGSIWRAAASYRLGNRRLRNRLQNFRRK